MSNLQTKIEKYGTVNIESINDMSRFEIQFYDSAITESPGNRGISHLAEHLMCKSFMDDMEDDFNRYSISCNAYTGTGIMAFYISGLDEYVMKFKYDILDRLLNYTISKEDFEKEKLIVLEEYNLAFSKQQSAHYRLLNRKYFNDYGPIGEEKDIQDITYEDFISFKNERFTKPNSILNISKYNEFVMPDNYEYNMTSNDNKFIFSDYDFIKQDTPEYKDTVSIINFSNIVESDSLDVPALDILSEMYSNGLTSPLYKRIREELGYVYGLQFGLQELNDEQSIIMFLTTTSEENVTDLNEEFFNVLLDESHITQEKLDIIVENLTISERIADITKGSAANNYTDERTNVQIAKDTLTLEDIKAVHKKYITRENFITTTDREF